MDNLDKIFLPKWPGLLVVGDTVTKEQAAEILIRTDLFYFSSNDLQWKKMLHNAANIKFEDEESYLATDWDSLREAKERFRVLDLEYLCNDRIASCWIGGPHGWCNWDGKIFSNNYNIGKWPNASAIYEEWEEIARAFPFLKLKSQLFDGETSTENSKPAIQFNIADGKVKQVEIENIGPIIYRLDLSCAFIPSNIRERGCDLETFKTALEIAKRKN